MTTAAETTATEASRFFGELAKVQENAKGRTVSVLEAARFLELIETINTASREVQIDEAQYCGDARDAPGQIGVHTRLFFKDGKFSVKRTPATSKAYRTGYRRGLLVALSARGKADLTGIIRGLKPLLDRLELSVGTSLQGEEIRITISGAL